MLTAGSIAGGGFRLVRERPGAVAVWTLVYLAGVVALGLAVMPSAEVRAAAAAGRPPLAINTAPNLWIWLFELVFFLAFMVLFTAALRAALRPGESGFASLRLGMDELRMTGLALFLTIVLYLGLILIGLALAIPLNLLTLATGGTDVTILLVGEIVLLTPLAAWILVRLSLAYPLTLMRGRIVIGESWQLSRGRFWTLFGGYLIVVLVVTALSIAAAALTAGPQLLELLRGRLTLETLQAVAGWQLARQMEGVDAMMVAGWVLSALVGGLSVALYAGAMAAAARELAVDREGMARTFA
ncbi:MAG TPA: hypothetical protein VGW40_07115 [Allosphingosinicella sp.]|nr:hypothetical protein [Allosphingosinicella sp.]